jgi:hypothetical protein
MQDTCLHVLGRENLVGQIQRRYRGLGSQNRITEDGLGRLGITLYAEKVSKVRALSRPR